MIKICKELLEIYQLTRRAPRISSNVLTARALIKLCGATCGQIALTSRTRRGALLLARKSSSGAAMVNVCLCQYCVTVIMIVYTGRTKSIAQHLRLVLVSCEFLRKEKHSYYLLCILYKYLFY